MAGIRINSQREIPITVIGSAPAIEQRFNAIQGTWPNTFQIKNYGVDPLYVGLKPSVTNLVDFEMLVVGSGGTNILTYPRGVEALYFYTTNTANVLIRSFVNDEIYTNDLDKNVSTTIVNSTVTSSVSITGQLPAGVNELGFVKSADGNIATLGAKADAAVTNPAATSGMIGLLKGIVTLLGGVILAAGSAIIGKVGLVDSVGAAFGTAGNPINVAAGTVSISYPATPQILNVTMTSANTEYSQAIPANAKKIIASVQDGDASMNFRLAYATGKVATPTAPFMKYLGSVEYDTGLILMSATPGSIYFACSAAGKVMQLEIWT